MTAFQTLIIGIVFALVSVTTEERNWPQIFPQLTAIFGCCFLAVSFCKGAFNILELVLK